MEKKLYLITFFNGDENDWDVLVSDKVNHEDVIKEWAEFVEDVDYILEDRNNPIEVYALEKVWDYDIKLIKSKQNHE